MNVIKCVSITIAACWLLASGTELEAQSKKRNKDLEKVVESNSEKIERAAETLERIAEHLEAQSDQLNDHLAEWMDENGSELEEWAEQHASEWQKWAAGFENRMEKWADEQEHHWEKWADEYSSKWEQWGQQLEKGELDSEQMNKLMQRNMEMLSKMPWEKLVKEAIRESAAGLNNAPWENLNDMHEMVGRSVELSLERLEQSGDKSKNRTTQNQHLRDVVKKLQMSLEQKQHELEAASKAKIWALKQELENSDLSEKKKAQVMEALERQYQDAKTAQLAKVKEKLAHVNRLRNMEKKQAVEQQMTAMMEAKRAQAMADRAKVEAHRAQLEIDRARAAELARMAGMNIKAIEEAKKAVEKNKEAVDLYRALEIQERKSTEKESELDELRNEIQKLREEIERLKKDRD